MAYVIAYDIGTTGIKTCIFAIEETIKLVASASDGYNLYVLDNGGVEQDEEEWWNSLKKTTATVLKKSGLKGDQIAGLSFCSQMQGLVLVDEKGIPVHRPMSYMDQRATEEIKKGIANGFTIAGANVFKLIPSLLITGAVSSSVKDPLWKYKWIEAHEPENFARARWWLDVKEYFIGRCTNEFIMTEDSAFSTLIYDTRKGRCGWSKKMCQMFGVNEKHLPKIIKSTDIAGFLTREAADELGLKEKTPVFGGGGDATLIGIGSGCVNLGDTHIYSGTSGWVSTIVDKQMVDANAMIAAIVGAQTNRFNYFAEMETAGKCLEWVKDHLALDEIDIYLEHNDITGSMEKVYTSLYDYMTHVVKTVPAGSNGVIFTPWLHGNRCPFEDPNASGMFFNISLETGKRDMIRAVLEGICFHLRWMLECQDKKIKTSDPIRFSGGGALSDVTNQILADIIGRKIEVVESPQNVGAVGAAAIMAVGLHLLPKMEDIKKMIPVEKEFFPNSSNKKVYDRQYEIFKKLYAANKKNFKILNQKG
ncbi:MAG: FGGY-family carbohydrate kinase [Lachnospiraceae bacterium]|nr:FGGY-family carbohydrate kinase [Lachnospiraceae bacterium]